MLPTLLIATALTATSRQSAGDNGRPISTEENTMENRADRFFDYREWASAGSLYGMLLSEHPTEIKFYGRAIVAAGMTGDTLRQVDLTGLALKSHVAVDSLFSSVERTSFSLGQTSLYEHYLLLTKRHEPWLARIIDSYLMRYYTYRRDPNGMIAYSKSMLLGNPDSEPLLYTLAQGYLLSGDTDAAIKVYLRIIARNPRALEALLYLANYYHQLAPSDKAAARQALIYFRQAEEISPTPYISDAITSLSGML